jgi:hypothetical protein
MPQTDCYLCRADVLEVAEALFANGATITPDIEYPTRETLVISNSENLRQVLDESAISLLYVLSRKWQRSPLQLSSVMKRGREIFHVSQTEGGPTLEIFYLKPREVEGTLAVPAGFISYRNRFWNPDTSQMESAPKALSDAYRTVRSWLMQGGRTVVRPHRKLIVTKNTMSSGLNLIDLKKHVQDKPCIINPSEISEATGK